MKRAYLARLHRYVGICVAPFVVGQTVSGLLLDFGLFRRVRTVRGAWGPDTVHTNVEQFLASIHFGPGLVNDSYHLLLGAGIIWMAVSGWMLYLRGRRLRNAGTAHPGAGVAS